MFSRDGRMLWVNDSGSLVNGPNGRQLLHGVLVDITEQKQLQSRLQQTERMEAVGQLASGVAHDFNNLLTIIKGYSSLLMERNPEGRDGHAAKEIRQAADRAASLTHQLAGIQPQANAATASTGPEHALSGAGGHAAAFADGKC